MLGISPELIAELIAIARTAGEAILAVYNAAEKTDIDFKEDGSPVTRADLAAHQVIVQALEQLLPIPIISEEDKLPDFAERRTWSRYWLIDPLDGTKEFVRRNDEFTVNIALIQQGVAVLGVVHVPVQDETYVGVNKTISQSDKPLAEKYYAGKKIANLLTRNLSDRFTARQSLDVLISHRHSGKENEMLLQYIARHWPVPLHYIKAGSSLKFCWLAEGRADFYPRLAPTSEWDTAAAQAVLEAAGGAVLNANDLTPLIYNRSDSILNPWFFAIADEALKAQLITFVDAADHRF